MRLLTGLAWLALFSGAGFTFLVERGHLGAAVAPKERERVVYKRKGEIPDDDPVIKSFADFVELCERKERETGEPVTILASY